jgi:hypothetical protein
MLGTRYPVSPHSILGKRTSLASSDRATGPIVLDDVTKGVDHHSGRLFPFLSIIVSCAGAKDPRVRGQ